MEAKTMQLRKAPTGHKGIDGGHQAIIEMADRMAQAIDDRDTRTAYEHVLNEIMAHFSEEEALMETYAYPRMEEHRREHENLIQIVRNYREHGGDNTTISSSLTHFVEVWWIKHIQTADKDLADYLSP